LQHWFRTAVAATALFAGSAMVAAAQEEVIWWDFLSGGDGVRMKALIDDFNAQHPDIKITATTLEWGVPYYTKVRTAAAVGQGPDVMTYHLSRVPIALDEGVLSPITDEDLAAAGLGKDDFFPAAIEAASGEDGALYAIPFDVHAVVLYYNKALLEGTPYLDAEGNLTGITNLAEFEAALQAMKDKGVQAPLSFATGDDGATWRVFYTLFEQQGGTLIEGTEVLPGDNADKAAKAIEIMTKWREAGYTPEQAEYEASVALFSGGDAAFHINGVWEVPTFNDLHAGGSLADWGAVEVPTLLDQPATWADSHAFAIPNQPTKEMTPEKRKAVLEVVGWMEKNAIRWADAGHIPAYVPVVESAEYAAMQPNATYAPLAEHAAFDPRSKIAGVASPVYDAAINIIAPATHGFMTPEDAVAQMKDSLQPLLN
jgi:multiple sugar transport system substrate-binding protein